jgi:hypothetical protein
MSSVGLLHAGAALIVNGSISLGRADVREAAPLNWSVGGLASPDAAGRAPTATSPAPDLREGETAERRR